MIHSRAIVHSKAEIDHDVVIGAWSYIGPNVKILSGNVLHNNVTIENNTFLDKNNEIYSYAVLGSDPQDLKYQGEETSLEIGKKNKIREFVTINRGTKDDDSLTKLGDNNLLMAYSHVAHDCILKNNIILANNATLAGHVTVLDHAIVGAFCAVHQFCNIGEFSMLSHGVLVNKNVLPYTMVSPINRVIKTSGLNIRGLNRNDFLEKDIKILRQAYKLIYRKGLSINNTLIELKILAKENKLIDHLYQFINNSSERGFI